MGLLSPQSQRSSMRRKREEEEEEQYSSITAKQRLEEYLSRACRGTGSAEEKREERERAERILSALASRSYHLPGNGPCADWVQYVSNNHPIFGVCCHHPLHPVRFAMRIVNLVGSIAVGLAITNVIWLLYRQGDEVFMTISIRDYLSSSNKNTNSINNVTTTIPSAVMRIDNNGTANNTSMINPPFQQEQEEVDMYDFQITQGMAILWTLGTAVHALFDNVAWFLTACICCLPGNSLQCLDRCRFFGSYIVVTAVIICTAVATLVVVMRAAIEQSGGTKFNLDHVVNGTMDLKWEAFDFLVSYGIELVLALFVYYFLVATVLFRGWLGCGRIPILGGRPYEILQEEKKKLRGQQQQQQQQ